MISKSYNFCEFIDSIQSLDHHEMIDQTNREATSAERIFYQIPSTARKSSGSHVSFQYAILLKDLVLFMRHGFMTSRLKNLDDDIQSQLEGIIIPNA